MPNSPGSQTPRSPFAGIARPSLWLNTEAEGCPGWGAVEVFGWDPDTQAWKGRKPTADGRSDVAFNDAVPVPAGRVGQFNLDDPAFALLAVGVGGTDPSPRQTWGTKVGKWLLYKDQPGFVLWDLVGGFRAVGVVKRLGGGSGTTGGGDTGAATSWAVGMVAAVVPGTPTLYQVFPAATNPTTGVTAPNGAAVSPAWRHTVPVPIPGDGYPPDMKVGDPVLYRQVPGGSPVAYEFTPWKASATVWEFEHLTGFTFDTSNCMPAVSSRRWRVYVPGGLVKPEPPNGAAPFVIP